MNIERLALLKEKYNMQFVVSYKGNNELGGHFTEVFNNEKFIVLLLDEL